MNKQKRRYPNRRALLWTFTGLLLVILLAPLSGYLLSDAAVAQSAQEETNERANFWRAVREGTAGYSAVQGQETNVLIQGGGENWRALRNGPASIYGTWVLAGMLALIVIFFLLRGQIKIAGGRSGLTVERWTLFERVLHWYTAILFIILAITGLSLAYGRVVLIPVLGKDGFAAYAGFAKDLHNYLGPFFAAGLVIGLVKWIRHNIPKGRDFIWLFKGGGLIGSAHPRAGRLNGGEKIWFWLLFFLGLAVIGSGFVLDFPNYGQTRETMQLAHLIHFASALVLMAVAMGHIYIAFGTEGTIEGMTTGRVDAEWAKHHHDVWYEELMEEGVKPEPTPEPVAGHVHTEPRST